MATTVKKMRKKACMYFIKYAMALNGIPFSKRDTVKTYTDWQRHDKTKASKRASDLMCHLVIFAILLIISIILIVMQTIRLAIF